MSAPAYFSVVEAASILGMDSQTLRSACRSGAVPAERRGPRYLLPHAVVAHLYGGPLPPRPKTNADEVHDMDRSPIDHRELNADELADLRSLWNDCVAGPLDRKQLKAAGIRVGVCKDSTDIARVAVTDPAKGVELLITLSSRGDWRPIDVIDPGALDDDLLAVTGALENAAGDLNDRAVSNGEIVAALHEVCDGVRRLADSLDDRNPAAHKPRWRPIPDGEEMLAWAFAVPADNLAEPEA